MISVLTATLGRRPHMLAEAIASVRAQTHTDWEHIIIDDGSFSVPEVDGVTVLRVSHRGLGPARNAGLEIARGQVIALLDDDDLWLPQHLEKTLATMQSTHADVVYADCDEVGRRDGYAIDVRDFDAELLERENFVCVPATIVRAEALRSVGGFPAGSLEDWGLWKAMARAGCSFVHLREVTVTYRFHEDNLTYGGADPERTRMVKELRERAESGVISWNEFTEREAEVWR